MKKFKILYYTTTVVSMLVGVWHFFVPVMFQWYEYLPMQYKNLIVGIDYTNYCFSLLLFGGSLLSVIWGKRALAENKEAKEFYLFLTIVWIFRACLATFIEPWPLEPVAWAAIIQLVLSDLLALMMVIVSIKFYKDLKKRGKMEFCIEKITSENRQQVNEILKREWESTDIIVRGKRIDGTKLDGFVAIKDNDIIGLITYKIENNECEIVSLNSFEENKGIATKLIDIVKELAINEKCTRLKLITTNDNIRGIEFYQKRGFVLSNIYINAIENSRKLKPAIPLYADNGLPIRDEIEFEIKL